MAESMQFAPRKEILSLEELLQVGRALVATGITKIRITGGEPLIRNNILWLVEQLGALPELKELSLSTNGARLDRYATQLRAAGVKRVNISLDSLNPERFRDMTRIGNLQDVLNGIDAAIDADFDAIKLNSVILGQRNDDEILALTAFALEKGVDIAFIEEMPLGAITEHDRGELLVSSDTVRHIIQREFPLDTSDKSTNGPSRYYSVRGSNTHVGFISPHSNNFCAACNRVRITVEGRLLLCLGHENSVDLRQLLRTEKSSIAQLSEEIRRAIDLKPAQHFFDRDDTPDIVRFMSVTGG